MPDVTTEFTFFPDVDLVVGEQYYVGMDNGLFTDASGTLEISIKQDVIPDGLYWTRINDEPTWNDYGGDFDIASRIEMRCVAEPVPVDIKPGSCPNPLNVKSGGGATRTTAFAIGRPLRSVTIPSMTAARGSTIVMLSSC